MAVWHRLRSPWNCHRSHILKSLERYSTNAHAHDPLRVLFCGADEFSIASLNALHNEHIQNNERIASIDVVCRPGKRIGRGLKEIREVPIALAARKLHLQLHQIDSFTGWQAPTPNDLPINLIVAVSFGLFIPSRILSNATYGGLNVHPSMLPDLHGPAPLHHTLLQRRRRTGVTVQTLHPRHFDQGAIVAQTPDPGIEHGCNAVPELRDLLATEGATMLLDCIKDGSFIPSHHGNSSVRRNDDHITGQAASKIEPDDCRIDWASWTSEDVLLRQRVIGPLWSMLSATKAGKTFEKRVIWSGGFTSTDYRPEARLKPGQPFVDGLGTEREQVYLGTVDGKLLQVNELTIAGQDRKAPVASAKQAGLLHEQTTTGGNKPNADLRLVNVFLGNLS